MSNPNQSSKKEVSLTVVKNKKIQKLERHLKKFPEDNQAKEQLELIKSGKVEVKPRKSSQNKGGWVQGMINSTKDNNYKEKLKHIMKPELRKAGSKSMARFLKLQRNLNSTGSHVKLTEQKD